MPLRYYGSIASNACSLAGDEMHKELLSQIEGALALSEWMGGFPTLHDATMTDFQIRGDGSGHLKAQAFRMTDKVDERGFYVLEKHCLVTLRFEGISQVELGGFLPGEAILFGLAITKPADEFVCELTSSYGVAGQITARLISVTFEPMDVRAA